MNKISIRLPEDRQQLKRLLGISGPGRPNDSKRPEVTLQEIADKAGCSIGSVALYFNNQESPTSIPQRIQTVIIEIINKNPTLLQRLLEHQKRAARAKCTKKKG